MITKLQFEITWEDVEHIAERQGHGGGLVSKTRACELLADIESKVRGWFEASKWDAISDSLTKPVGGRASEPRDHNDAEGVVTMRDLA